MARTPNPRPRRRAGRRGPAGRVVLLAAGAGLAGLTLAGCGGAQLAGSAAVVGDQRITDAQVAQDVADVQAETNATVGEPNASLTQKTVERLVTQALVSQVAAQVGVNATQGEIDTLRKQAEDSQGGPDQLAAAAGQSGVPVGNIDEVLRTQLLVQKIGAKLAPNGDPNTQNQAAFEAVVKYGQEHGVTVSPRFGSWNIDQVQMGARPTDVSVAAPGSPLDLATQPPGAVPSPAAS